MEEFTRLKALVLEIEPEIEKTQAGNKAAGTRVRKQMQDIKKLCQDIREKVIALRGGDDDAAPQTPAAPQA